MCSNSTVPDSMTECREAITAASALLAEIEAGPLWTPFAYFQHTKVSPRFFTRPARLKERLAPQIEQWSRPESQCLAGRHVPPISRAVFLIQAFLRRFKAISDGGTYFMGALKRIPIPFNRSGIEFIMQDPGDCPTFKRCPALAGPSPLIAFSGDSSHVQTADYA